MQSRRCEYCSISPSRNNVLLSFSKLIHGAFRRTQWSQSAYRYGANVAKFALFPVTQAQLDLRSCPFFRRSLPSSLPSDALIPTLACSSGSAPADGPSNILSSALRDFHASYRVVFSLRVQLLQDLDAQPVEDIGIEWDEERFPFEEVAVLEFEEQDSWIPAFRVWWDDRITCKSVWRALRSRSRRPAVQR